MAIEKNIIYRISQLIGLLLGMRIFMLIFFGFALYASTLFLYNQEDNLHDLVFDFKIHSIILCSLLSLAAGGIINQFYDLEKDRLTKPFRTKFQGFLQQKYFLYTYIFLNSFTLGICAFISSRVFIYFLIYQFLIWFYSHKLSKQLIINNLSFVSLSLYPFFGILVYYNHFSYKIALVAIFVFLLILIIDIVKDFLSMRSDKIFNYSSLPNSFGIKPSLFILIILIIFNIFISLLIMVDIPEYPILKVFFGSSILVFLFSIFQIISFKFKKLFWLMNLLRIWLFLGVVFMFINAFFERF